MQFGIITRLKLIQLIGLLKILIGVICFWGKMSMRGVEIFNQTIPNIFHNFIPSKTILYDDRDPLWVNKKIKSLFKKKNTFYRRKRKSISFDLL